MRITFTPPEIAPSHYATELPLPYGVIYLLWEHIIAEVPVLGLALLLK
jgi:hypothetical protein